MAELGNRGGSALGQVRILARLARLSFACGEAALRLPFSDGQRLMQRWSRGILSALGVELSLAAPLPDGGRLILANHLSWLDPLVLMALRSSLPLAKEEVAAYPGLGPMARRAGLRFVRREDPNDRVRALRQIRSDWAAGKDILLFPEGTTTDGSSLAPLHRGGHGLAWHLGIPVRVVRLSSPDAHYPWLGDASLGPHLRGLIEAPRTRLRVEPGPLFHPSDFPTCAGWLEAIRAALSPEPLHGT